MKRPNARDVFTLPNAVTLTGAVLVIRGCLEPDPAKAFALITSGRACDLMDGLFARYTGQESDFGATLDATTDKLTSVLIPAKGVTTNAVPAIAATAMVTHNAASVAASIRHEKYHSGESWRPSKIGKLAVFCENLGMMAYLAKPAYETIRPDDRRTARVLRLAGHLLTTCGVGLGMVASLRYAKVSKTNNTIQK